MKNVITAITLATAFAPKKDVRYYLNSIALYIDNNQIVAVAATDGSALCLFGNITPKSEVAVIAHKDIPTLKIALEQNNLKISDFNNTLSNNFQLSIGHFLLEVIDGRYPDITRVIPSENRECDVTMGVSLDTKYLMLLDKVTKGLKKLIRKREIINMIMSFGGSKDSTLCTFKVNESVESDQSIIDDCIVVIMPKRIK